MAEVEHAVVLDPGGPVEQVDGHGRGEPDRLLDASGDDALDALPVPARLAREEDLRQLERTLDPDAPGGEVASRAAEEVPRGRVVQVYVVSIRKHELHVPERVLR